MKNVIATAFSLFTFISLIISCVNRIDDETDSPRQPMALVTVNTRTNNSEASLTLPIRIFAMSSGNKCVSSQTITEAEDNVFSIKLPVGVYTIYAISGMDEATYLIPNEATVNQETSLSLINTNGLHSELQADNAAITLEDGTDENLTLTLTRIVAGVTAVVKDIPSNITQVSIGIQPLYEEVMINGAYKGTGTSRTIIPLTKSSSGNWETSKPYYILPGQDKATISISLTDANGTKDYSYSSYIRIEANQKVEIEAIYKSGSPQLSGSITGTDWAGTQKVIFDFGQSSGDNNPKPPVVGQVPVKGSIYQGCYVLDVIDKPGNQSEVFLLSSAEAVITGSSGNPAASQIESYLQSYTDNGITGWETSSFSMAVGIYSNFVQINTTLKNQGMTELHVSGEYIYKDENGVYRWFSKNEKPTEGRNKPGNGASYRIRLVKRLVFSK